MISIPLMLACYETPSISGREHGMVGFLTAVLAAMPGVQVRVDAQLNVYATKTGPGDFYPLLVAHTDTVQPMARIDAALDGVHFYGTVPGNPAVRAGIGADDKAGILAVLDILAVLPKAKAIFCTSEEVGYLGALRADASFFDDVGYALEFDCPGRRTVAVTCGNESLFSEGSLLWQTAGSILAQHGRTELQHHPYTDLTGLRKRFKFECLNVAVGYYQMHSRYEFVRYQDWVQARECGVILAGSLGCRRYAHSGVPFRSGQVGRMDIDEPESYPTGEQF